MILGHIYCQVPFKLPSILQKGLEFLHGLDFQNLSSGRVEIDGDKIFAEIVDTVTHFKDESKPESHQKYLDIHYLISGKEYIGVTIDTQNTVVDKPFKPGSDIQFYKSVQHETFIELYPGSYVILFPQDIHRPCCCIDKPSNIRKAIVKISMDQVWFNY